MKKKIISFILALTLACSANTAVFADDMIVETASSEIVLDPDITMLDKTVRHQDMQTVISWADAANIIDKNEIAELDMQCSWETFLTYLWRTNGAPATANSILLGETDTSRYDSVVTWAIRNGLTDSSVAKKQMKATMCHGDAQWVLWHLAGSPTPSAKQHKLPIGSHENFELWACDTGLIIREEQPNSNPSAPLSREEALLYIYYSYHRRSETVFPITVEQFLSSCQNVVDTARTNGYVYGSSSSAVPTADGIISCDRLIAKALWDLGYTDQPAGGETCSTLDAYLSAHGFERSTSLADAKRGSIMLVTHVGEVGVTHAFVFASDFDMNTMRGDRYDCGSDVNIQSVQPLRGKGFWYRTDSVIVYNIPE